MILMIAAILWLEIITYTHAGCPSKCNCSSNTVNCISKNLEYVPYFENLSNNPVIIDLSGNSISMIDLDDFSFDKSDQVIEIYLNSSELIMIEEKSFGELENLQELYLGDNFLNTLPENFITNNENMILLDLSNNYFTEMPKIKSESLEFLAIAKSGMSKIGDDALASLPNLRVLLLQQNNLKRINPNVFEPMNNLFFVRVAYNPWQCNCKTVKLFNYLTVKGFADITEPVQCQSESKLFIDIYNDKGVTNTFKEQCNKSENDVSESDDYDYQDSEELYEMEQFLKDIDAVEKNDSNQISVNSSKKYLLKDVEIDDMYFTNFYYSILLGVAIVISLVVGAICGSCITYKLVNVNIRQTESWKHLLVKSDENFA